MIELQGDKIRTFWVAMLAVLTVLLSSCSATGTVTGEEADKAAETADVAPGVETEPGADEREAPLDRALFGSSDDLKEVRLARERWIEDSVDRCMEMQGFDYVPQAPEELSTVRYVPEPERDGWNIVNAVRNSLADFNKSATGYQLQYEAPETFTDSQVADWKAAMFGDGQDGCVPRAFGEAPEVEEIVENDQWLQQSLAELEERTDSDPRVFQAGADAEQCLNDEGLSSAKVQQKEEQLRLEMEPVYEFLNNTPEQPSLADVPEDLREIMDEVSKEERTYATISAACEETFNNIVGDVYREYEAEWVGENELLLAELSKRIDQEIQTSLSKYIDS